MPVIDNSGGQTTEDALGGKLKVKQQGDAEQAPTNELQDEEQQAEHPRIEQGAEPQG